MGGEHVEVGQRLLEARRFLGFSRPELAKRIDQSDRSVQAWELGINLPAGKALKAYLKLGVSPSWVLGGIGSMMISGASGFGGRLNHCKLIQAAQGDFQQECSPGTVSIEENRDLFTVTLGDDAMTPTYGVGDTLIVRGAVDPSEIDGIVVIQQQGRYTVRRAHRLLDGRVRLWADNPAVPVEEFQPLDVGRIKIVGILVGRIDKSVFALNSPFSLESATVP